MQLFASFVVCNISVDIFRRREKIPTLTTLLQLLCPEQDLKIATGGFKKGQLFQVTWNWKSLQYQNLYELKQNLKMKVQFWCALFRGWGMDRKLKTPLKSRCPYITPFPPTWPSLCYWSSKKQKRICYLLILKFFFLFLKQQEGCLEESRLFSWCLLAWSSVTCWTTLSLHMLLKTAEGENGKGSPQSVSHGLMRRRHGLCQSLQEQNIHQNNLSRISALSG